MHTGSAVAHSQWAQTAAAARSTCSGSSAAFGVHDTFHAYVFLHHHPPWCVQVRTQTLVKNAIIQIDAAPFKQWYQQHYGVELGQKKGAETAEAETKVGKGKGAGAQGAAGKAAGCSRVFQGVAGACAEAVGVQPGL
jgi:hypothetical protein